MPFTKGRQKTGGRKKKSEYPPAPAQKLSAFGEQLKAAGLDYAKELAKCLKSDDFKVTEKYLELKHLLPYMAPRLLEQEVRLDEADAPAATPTAPKEEISTDDLLAALSKNDAKAETKPRPSDPAPLGAGDPPLQVSGRAEINLEDISGEPEEE